MSTIIPFPAWRPKANLVNKVICPPYDIIDGPAAKSFACNNPYSFLHISLPEIDFDSTIDPYSKEVYAKGQTNWQAFQKDGIFTKDPPSYYIYRMNMGAYSQTGIVCGVSGKEYDDGLIKQHEKTREEKVTDRVAIASQLQAHLEPVILVYPDSDPLDALIKTNMTSSPLYQVTDHLNIEHILWQVSDTSPITTAMQHIPALYIADGHHRSLTGAMLRRQEQDRRQSTDETALYNYFPAVVFPAHEMRVFVYDWQENPSDRPLADFTMYDIMALSDKGGIMPPKSTWFEPKLNSGLFVYSFEQ